MTSVGFDLHKRHITACALNAAGEIIAEMRQLTTALEAIVTWLGALPGPVTVGLEATLYWEWLATRLAEHGHTVRVAHAFQVKLIWQARAKTDSIDARKLRLDVLCATHGIRNTSIEVSEIPYRTW